MTVAGAHTVGAPDGGPGLPGVGWSREHGDLRVPHFLGLHAMQLLPVISLALRRRNWPEATRVRLIVTAAGSYTALFVVLLVQALRGQSVVDPDVTDGFRARVLGSAHNGCRLAGRLKARFKQSS